MTKEESDWITECREAGLNWTIEHWRANRAKVHEPLITVFLLSEPTMDPGDIPISIHRTMAGATAAREKIAKDRYTQIQAFDLLP